MTSDLKQKVNIKKEIFEIRMLMKKVMTKTVFAKI